MRIYIPNVFTFLCCIPQEIEILTKRAHGIATEGACLDCSLVV